MAGRSIWSYLWPAFTATPAGMFVSPNLIGVTAIGLLGLINPGFWLIGAGIEVAYLTMLASNVRFQNIVDARQYHPAGAATATMTARAAVDAATRRARLLSRLDAEDRRRQDAVEQRCREILAAHPVATAGNGPEASPDAVSDLIGQQQADGLARLAWVHLRFLVARAGSRQVVREGDARSLGLRRRIDELQVQADGAGPGALRDSLLKQRELLISQLAAFQSAREQLSLIDAELERLSAQVDLLRQQALLSSDPSAAARAVDLIGETLGSSARILNDQRLMTDDLNDMDAPPPLLAAVATDADPDFLPAPRRVKERQ